MWNVKYKRHNASQLWSVLGDYDNKESALIHASRALDYYFIVKVTDPEGRIIWSNEPNIATKLKRRDVNTDKGYRRVNYH